MASRPLLLFDMDGTLIIPREEDADRKAKIHARALQSRQQMKSVAASHGIPLFELDSLDRMAHIWNRARRYAEAHDFSDDRIASMMAGLNEAFNRQEEMEHSQSVLLPGAVEVLDGLRRDSYSLGMVTTASRTGFERVSRSEEYGCFGNYFTYSVTRDECVYIKPDPEPINRILRLFGRSDFLYIGDSDHDAEATKAAGGGFILLNTKLHDERVLQRIHSDWVIDSLGDLPRMISRIHTRVPKKACRT